MNTEEKIYRNHLNALISPLIQKEICRDEFIMYFKGIRTVWKTVFGMEDTL